MKGKISRNNQVVVCCLLLLFIVIIFLCMKDSVPLSHLHFTLSKQNTEIIQNNIPAQQVQNHYKNHVTAPLIVKHFIEHVIDPSTVNPPIPGNKELKLLSNVELEELYYSYAENGNANCVEKTRVGKVASGEWYLCHDPEYRPRQPCTVYSFGDHYNFSFEDDVSDRYGCTVHAFYPRVSLKNNQRSQLVFFHNLGLVLSNGSNNKVWKHLTLGAIKTKLNHTKINVMKMDIGLKKMPAPAQILASSDLNTVSQLLLEIRLDMNKTGEQDRSLLLKGLKIFRRLHREGFRVFYSLRNNTSIYTSKWSKRSRVGCHKISMVNVKARQT